MPDPDDPLSIDDPVDFYHQWPQLRLRVLALIDNKENDPEDQELLHWMVKIVDRIGPLDLGDAP